MDRDDWKWMDEEDMKEYEEDEGKKAEGEFQCPRCTHWLPADASWCGYCGTVLEGRKEKRK